MKSYKSGLDFVWLIMTTDDLMRWLRRLEQEEKYEHCADIRDELNRRSVRADGMNLKD